MTTFYELQENMFPIHQKIQFLSDYKRSFIMDAKLCVFFWQVYIPWFVGSADNCFSHILEWRHIGRTLTKEKLLWQILWRRRRVLSGKRIFCILVLGLHSDEGLLGHCVHPGEADQQEWEQELFWRAGVWAEVQHSEWAAVQNCQWAEMLNC